MDRALLTVRLFQAAIAGALWVAGLETTALALRGGISLRSLMWIFVGTACLTLLPLVADAAIGLFVWPRVAQRSSARTWQWLGAIALISSVALHVANVGLYVRLYAPIHMALSALTLLCAFLGGVWLVSLVPPRVAQSAPAKPRRLVVALLLLFWLFGTAACLIKITEDPALRVDVLERSTVLAHELHALDLVTGILVIPEPTARQAGAGQVQLDSAVLVSVTPAPVLDPSGLARGANVVWVTIDSMRADRWLAGGAQTPQLPTLEALAKESTRFTRAYAPSCWTIHSMSSVLFGRLPSQLTFTPVGVDPSLKIFPFGDGNTPIDPLNFKKATPAPYTDQGPGLIDHLREGGYETATVVSYAFYLRDAGITRAFEHVDEERYRALGPGATGLPQIPMVERATKFLDSRDKARPFFLWLHFMEPHAPYEAHDALAEGQGPIQRYDSELRYVDTQLKALQDAVQARALHDNTLWIVHADHGEEFGDHGGEFHATTLYEEIVHVPLLMRLPPKLHIEPRSIDKPVGLLDLGPTLLDVLGIPSAQPFMGRSLAPALLTGAWPDRIQLMECDRFAARKRAYIRWPFKLILDRALGTTQLFALPRDPHEQENLVSQEPGLATVLTAELNEIMRSLAPQKSGVKPAQSVH